MIFICHETRREILRSTHHIYTSFQRKWHLFQERGETRLATDKKKEVPLQLKKMYQCDLCGYTTSHKSLKQHKNTVHNKEGNTKFICESCPFTCKSSAGLEIHKNWRHRDDKKYECDICPYKSTIKRELWNHIKKLHKKM